MEKGKHPLRIQKESLRVLDRGFIDDSERELEGFGERILGFVGVFRGYNIGIRLIDEFLAKSNVSRCNDFRETTDVIAKVLYCLFGVFTCYR